LAVLVPLAVIGAYLAALALYPFIENWITGDRREHHLLDRPRNVPTRTAIGVAGIVFYGVLWGAASADIAATTFSLAIEGVILFFQIALLTGPIAAFVLTRRICRALQLKDREIVLHGFETGRVVRLPGGEYVEAHRPVDRYERWRLGAYDDAAPLELHPDRRGRIGLAMRIRAVASRFFFEDRIEPVVDTTPALTTETEGAPQLPSRR
ncbi:MAG: ubiquinol-cytochrome c reductase cytochrome b subunit, partial [Rhodoglobus sp.]